MLAGSSTNFFPFLTPFGFAMPAGMMPFSAGMSSSFSVYTLFFFFPSLVTIDLVFCSPPGLANDSDFCLRLDMPSGALPVGFDFDFDFENLLELPPDFPLAPLLLVDGLVVPILGKVVCGKVMCSGMNRRQCWGTFFGQIGVLAAGSCRWERQAPRQQARPQQAHPQRRQLPQHHHALPSCSTTAHNAHTHANSAVAYRHLKSSWTVQTAFSASPSPHG
jgi:hypothetical protein